MKFQTRELKYRGFELEKSDQQPEKLNYLVNGLRSQIGRIPTAGVLLCLSINYQSFETHSRVNYKCGEKKVPRCAFGCGR